MNGGGRVALLAWLVTVLLLTGCAHRSGARFEPTGSSLPRSVELADTPFYPQRRYQCGPAALASVLGAEGLPVTPDELRPLVYIPDRRGSLQAEMLAAPARFGLLGSRLPPEPEALLATVAAGRPVLVLLNLGVERLPVWHYAVVVGYDLDRGEIYLRSGEERRKLRRLGDFLERWQAAGSWAMVVTSPEQVPASVDETGFLRAAARLERAGKPAQARVAYRAAAQRWPGSVAARGGAGNTAFATGDLAAAEEAWREALAIDPGAVLIMNNLALVLQRQGCRQAALAVIDCALRQRDLPLLRRTRDEIVAGPAGGERCRALPCASPAP